ncbi:MAG: inosine-uridine nucleoside N-ribohydrolase [Parasphingorhabdus sp.]|jgi:inosine-uridine nucleoside N-ribohydrolase
MNPQKVIIDTDPGIDDAMAIIYAHLDPNIELIGLTSIFGNVTIDTATRNALALTEMLGSSATVAGGARQPLEQDPKEVAWEVHGREGFGDVPPMSPSRPLDSRPAKQFICDMVNQHPGEVVLCPVGPLTNIALALQHDPSIAEKVKSVVIMGGSLDEGGNVTPSAEANIWQDPHAADFVFAAQWPMIMIGLDVTHQVVCTPDDFAELPDSSPNLGGFLNQASQFYFDFHARVDGIRGCHMHDPTAVISIAQPKWFSTTAVPLKVVLDGEQVGMTYRATDTSRPAINVAMGIDADAVKHHFLNTIKTGD